MKPVGADRFCGADVEVVSVSCGVAVFAYRLGRASDICKDQAELGKAFLNGGMRVPQYQIHFAE
jgi:hypothetical protein